MDSDRLGHWVPIFAMKYWHRLFMLSLRSRLILLVLLTALAMQAATTFWLYLYRRDHTSSVAMQLLSTTIHTIQAAIEELPSDRRIEFVERASGGQWQIISGRLPAEARLQRHNQTDLLDEPTEAIDNVRLSLRELVIKLQAELSKGTRVAWSHGSDAKLFVSIKNQQALSNHPINRDWLVIPIHLIDPPVHIRLITLWLTVLILLTLVALWFSWHITRPITALMDATDQLASGRPSRVIPTGPRETRVLGERFNGMLDALDASESIKRTLLAGLPHDLKGPMTRMGLRIAISDDEVLKEGITNDLEDMQRIANQFIQYLRGTDATAYEREPIPLDLWISERISNWQSAGSDVVLIGKPFSGSVMGDSLALSRLLDNLIDTGLHHGRPPVYVSLVSQTDCAVIRVSDHGEGIPAAKHQEAIEPFTRLDPARTRTGNVGLGLALAVMITRAHAGTLTLGQSATGGLEVQVSLPLMVPGQIAIDSPSN